MKRQDFIGSSQTNGHSAAASEPARQNAIVENARHEFKSVFGDLARGKRNWQVAAFILGAVAILEALATYRLAAAAHPIPYIVEVDRVGAVTAVAPATEILEPDARLIASQLADFLRSVRTVLPQAASVAQTSLLRRGYAFTDANAAGFLNNYFGEASHDPRVLGQRFSRDISVASALRIPAPSGVQSKSSAAAQTWRLQWRETDQTLAPSMFADTATVSMWEGYITLRIVPPRTADAIQANPLGIRITSISWTRLNGPAVLRDSLDIARDARRAGGLP
ncbi:MAG TPA: type IV secretion system protein [Gemmatimonadaceae bacterium]|jgi:type IV secretion system protein VirB5